MNWNTFDSKYLRQQRPQERSNIDRLQGSTILKPKQSIENIRPASSGHLEKQHRTGSQDMRKSLKQSEPLKQSALLLSNKINYSSNYFSQKENIEINLERMKIDKVPQEKNKKKSESVMKKNEIDQEQKAPDYQEYKKLQDKLAYLENKIINIKSHLDNNNQQMKKQEKSKGLTAKFFSNKQPELKKSEQQPIESDSYSSKLLKQSSCLKVSPKVELSTTSLSQFITQVKPQQIQINDKKPGKKNELIQSQQFQNSIKQLLQKPESSKSSSTQQKSFPKKQSSELSRNSSLQSLQKNVFSNQFEISI